MTCESCGAESDDLHPVHRTYVSTPIGDEGSAVRVLDEVERWCFACVTHYPHVPA